MTAQVSGTTTIAFLENEVLSLLTRLEQVQPFSMTMPMVPAASVSDDALRAVTNHLAVGRRDLRKRAADFLQNVRSKGSNVPPDQLQAGYSLLKLRFNAILDQMDIFADVLSQRAEHNVGIWVSGLDVLAADALDLSVKLYQPPALMCFLERGHGAAIRRARTRLPGGDLNPVAIIQVPRERMVGSGIAASLVHEVGHQGAALLGLVESLRTAIRQTQSQSDRPKAWAMYNLWISEIIADVWAMAHLGIGATLGLMSVVSLPRYFMFRMQMDDPHPFPWIRVRLSMSFGKALYPDAQWDAIENLWRTLYPTEKLSAAQKDTIADLEATMPSFINLVLTHQNQAMGNRPLHQIFPVKGRQPHLLRKYFQEWKKQPSMYHLAAPSLVFAVIGQARADGFISPEKESNLLSKMLNNWALRRSEDRKPRQDLEILREIEKIIS